ncbi:MAG: RNA polymerase sigma factor [Saprospiraceae bacterium]
MTQGESTDKELVKRILEGNPKTFEVIIRNTQGLVISIIYKMIKRPEDRKDLTQEVYLKVYDKLDSFKFNSKLSTWIGTITYNMCLNYLVKKRIPILDVSAEKENEPWQSIESKENQPTVDLFEKERATILAVEIEKLPPLYKTILSLFHMQELSYKEIAVITALPEGTLKSYLYRARRQLRTNLLLTYKREDL